MAQDKLDIRFDCIPQRGTVGMCIRDERTGAAVEVSKVVPKNMYRCFSFRQGAEAHAVHIELHRAWA